MSNIIIYTAKICPYCIKAKNLLESKGVSYQELLIDSNPELAMEAVKKSEGKKTVPQIFIDDFYVGGCDDLYALDKDGKLDSMLGL